MLRLGFRFALYQATFLGCFGQHLAVPLESAFWVSLDLRLLQQRFHWFCFSNDFVCCWLVFSCQPIGNWLRSSLCHCLFCRATFLFVAASLQFVEERS